MWMTIATVVTLLASLVSVGVTVSGVYNQIKNQDLRATIQQLVSNVAQSLKSGRLNVSKLLSMLNNKNSAALQNYLFQNPLVAKTFAEITADGDKIAALQNDINSIENEIAQYQNELASLGYSGTVFGLQGEQDRYNQVKAKLDKAVQDYHDKEAEIASTNVSTHRDFKVDLSHLAAVSQNINGGSQS